MPTNSVIRLLGYSVVLILGILGTSLVHAGVGGGPFVSGTMRASSNEEGITDIVRLSDGRFAVCGWTDSPDRWDDVAGGVQEEHGGSRDAFVAIFSNDLSTVDAFTFFGGLNNDSATSLTVDGTGTIIVVGTTESASLPTKTGAFSPLYSNYVDGFVFGFSPDLSEIRFGSYINGSKNELPLDVEVDELNTIYICGATSSQDGFPTTNGFDRAHDGGFDAFLMRLSENAGSMLYSTYFGSGSDDRFNDLAVDPSGTVALAATTSSASFPTYPAVDPRWWWWTKDRPYDWSYNGGNSDAALVIFSRDGARVIASTFFGGDGDDEGNAVVLASEEVTLIGTTTSLDLPSTGGIQAALAGGSDVMLARFNPTARTLLASSYYGGSGNEIVKGANLHAQGQFAIWGTSTSQDLPKHGHASRVDPAGGLDMFLSIMGVGSAEITTLIGGSSDDHAVNAAMEPDGGVVMVGTSISSMIPLDGQELLNNGNIDGVVIRYQRGAIDLLSPRGGEVVCAGQNVTVNWSTTEMMASDTYLVEWSEDQSTWTTVAGPVNGRQTSWSPPTAFIGTSGWLRVRSIRHHASVTEKVLRIDAPVSIVQAPQATAWVCPDGTRTIRVVANAPNVRYQWRRNSAPISGATTDSLLIKGDAPNAAGQYDVIVTGACGQNVTSSVCTVTLAELTLIRQHPRDTSLAQGGTLRLTVDATGSDLRYQWQYQGTELPNATSPTLVISNVTSANAGEYSCRVTGNCGLRWTDEVTVTVTGITSVQERPTATFTVYPNPTSGLLTLTPLHPSTLSLHPSTLSLHPSTLIEIYTLLGDRVLTLWNESNAATVTVDLSDLASGTYVVRAGGTAVLVVRD